MTQWPLQREAEFFYGNPRGRGGASVDLGWYRENIAQVTPPFFTRMMKPVRHFPIHKRCAAATLSWLNTVWDNAGRDQNVIDDWGMNVFSGSYSFRTMRGMQHLSMHAYGCAIDFDAPHNGLHDRTPKFAGLRREVVEPFLKLGGVWGGDWNGNGDTTDEPRCDGMHFQFARLRQI